MRGKESFRLLINFTNACNDWRQAGGTRSHLCMAGNYLPESTLVPQSLCWQEAGIGNQSWESNLGTAVWAMAVNSKAEHLFFLYSKKQEPYIPRRQSILLCYLIDFLKLSYSISNIIHTSRRRKQKHKKRKICPRSDSWLCFLPCCHAFP